MDSPAWHVATGLMATAATLGASLAMFILVGLRGDIRDLRLSVQSLTEKVGLLQGRTERRNTERD